jgi:hypothetical protein
LRKLSTSVFERRKVIYAARSCRQLRQKRRAFAAEPKLDVVRQL